MAQSTELTKLPMFGDAGTTPQGQSRGKAGASYLLGAEAGRVHHCAELCWPLLCSWGCPRVPLAGLDVSSAALSPLGGTVVEEKSDGAARLWAQEW